MAFETAHDLWLFGSCGRMKTDGNIEIYGLSPEGIEVTIVDLPPIDWLRTKGQAHSPRLFHGSPGFFDGKVDIVQPYNIPAN